MDIELFDRDGKPVAFISMDYDARIYQWNGTGVAYIYDESHIYGVNGKHLGWFIDGVIYDNNGKRAGFISSTCPIGIQKGTGKGEKKPFPEIRSRWKAPPMPNLSYDYSGLSLAELLYQGMIEPFIEQPSGENQ
jgi:hypothetical protein